MMEWDWDMHVQSLHNQYQEDICLWMMWEVSFGVFFLWGNMYLLYYLHCYRIFEMFDRWLREYKYYYRLIMRLVLE